MRWLSDVCEQSRALFAQCQEVEWTSYTKHHIRYCQLNQYDFREHCTKYTASWFSQSSDTKVIAWLYEELLCRKVFHYSAWLCYFLERHRCFLSAHTTIFIQEQLRLQRCFFSAVIIVFIRSWLEFEWSSEIESCFVQRHLWCSSFSSFIIAEFWCHVFWASHILNCEHDFRSLMKVNAWLRLCLCHSSFEDDVWS